MSDITGIGYGSKHNWIDRGTEQISSPKEHRSTRYICRNCNAVFRHYYHITPDIFQAIKSNGIKEECENENI